MGGDARTTVQLGRTFAYDALGPGETPDFGPQGAGDPEPPNPIQAADAWARYIWRYRRSSPWVVAALPLWLSIRIFYRVAIVVTTIVSLLMRPVDWAFWRLYEICGPLGRLCKSAYWTVYAWCGPAARILKKIYWRAVFPAFEVVWHAAHSIFWRAIFPILELPARTLGFSLLGAATPAIRTATPSTRDDLHSVIGRGVTDKDAIAWVAHGLTDFEALFDCLPRFGLARPMDAPLYIFFGEAFAEVEAAQTRLLGLRLRSGSPCQRVHLYAADSVTARKLEQTMDMRVTPLGGSDGADFTGLVQKRMLTEGPSLTVERFGPIVLLISALWGRVGSTLIFDAQTQFLIENGAVVVRVFVDHNPAHRDERSKRRNALLHENLTQTYPHVIVVAERDDSHRARQALHASTEYKARSGIGRYELELAGAQPLDADVLAWAGASARLCIVNHAMHMAFAERVSRSPIVLETHDVLTHQIESHGWPAFVSLKKEPVTLREPDQHNMWRRAHACINLSPEDNSAVSKHSALSAFVRPTASARIPDLRPWREVVRANSLSPAFAATEDIDILLWGDWHDGNVRAVQWLLEAVRPLSSALRNARIAVIGRVTRLLPGRLLKLPNVVSAGFVDRLEDFFGRAKVLAIADQEGSGVSIKAIEAIRYGRPFVSTGAGMRGLDLSEVGYTPAKDAAEFAEDLSALIADSAKRAERASIAHALYNSNISHDHYEAQWRRVLSAVDPSLNDGGPTHLTTTRAAAGPGPASAVRILSPPQTIPAHTSGTHRRAPVAPSRASHALAAVICTYNRYDVLPGAIESLLAQDIDPDELDILVVDNSQDQEAAAAYSSAYTSTRVRYILEPTPGLSNARNVAAEACNSKYIAYIDDDAVAAPDWASRLLAGFRQIGPTAGVAGGRIVPRWITPRPDWLPDELIGNLSIVDWGGQTRVLGRTEWIAGCNIAFERATLLALGGFSRALGRVGAGVALLSNEESAVIDKFADAGRSAIYVPDAVVEHLIEPARLSQEWFRRRAAWQAVSDYIKDPKRASAYAGAAAQRLRNELLDEEQVLPPGFVRPATPQDAFRRDVGLMYDIVIAMLAGGVELKEDGSSAASLQNKLMARVRRELQRNPQLRSSIHKLINI